MEKTNVPYEEWPEWIKTLTAFYFKPFMALIKNPKSVRNISFMSFAVGILVLAEAVYLDGLSDTPFGRKLYTFLIFGGVINLLLGVLNLFYNYKAHRWINENSSWEERFAHKSNGKHQFQYLLMFVVIIGVSWGVTCFFCC